MKRIYLSLVLLAVSMCLFTIQAQDYIIRFAGTGAATTIESVEVQNLTQATSLLLGQGEVLQLKGAITGMSEVSNQEEVVVIYPNPMTESSKIEFVAQSAGMYSIGLYNVIGEKALSGKYNLVEGRHAFTISGLATGIYNVIISSDQHKYSGKLISKSANLSNGSIKHCASSSLEQKSIKLKSKTTEKLVEMQYNEGDRLLLTASSDIYKSVKSIVPIVSTTEIFEFIGCTDGSGNNYKIVNIGGQVWMAENLRTAHYNDGTEITLQADGNLWLSSSPEYCWYNNDQTSSLNKEYGALYKWYVVESNKLCPTGWHVPSDSEWSVLEEYLSSQGYGGIEGTVIKSSSDWNGTDDFGFSGLPGGYRANILEGAFSNAGYIGSWWTSTEDINDKNVYSCSLNSNRSYIVREIKNKVAGFSVRCVKD